MLMCLKKQKNSKEARLLGKGHGHTNGGKGVSRENALQPSSQMCYSPMVTDLSLQSFNCIEDCMAFIQPWQVPVTVVSSDNNTKQNKTIKHQVLGVLSSAKITHTTAHEVSCR